MLAAHGSPSGRGSAPMKSTVTVRTTMSSPIVTMAMAKSGSPTMGRIVTRSMTSPANAMTTTATTTDSDHCSVAGSPVASRPGKLSTVAK